MANARTRRMLRELILEGKLADIEEAPKKEPEELPTDQLHLNIRKCLNIFKRIKETIFPSKKGQRQKGGLSKEGEPTHFISDIWGIVKLVVGYGIIGGLVLFLAIMLLSLQLPPLSDWIRGSGITQVVIVILGAGCFIYLVFDFSLFQAETRKERK